nr:proline-rich protein 36-like [Penaeus vannamei]
MSVICQTFVQNAWRKDLCSNCFKSKDEGSRGGGGAGDEGGVGGSRRYVGVAGSVYQRSYYSRNSWNAMVIAKSASSLKSPRLIKDMSCLVRSQSEARLLSELLGQGRGPEPKGGAADDKGDASSDLGSDASHDGSSSAPSSSASSEASASLANSDTASLRSEAESHHSDLEKEEAPERGPGRGAIAFRATLEEVIGFGGDVDYSDDEDDFMDDDDDDDDEDDFAQLSPDERVLRRLTEKNTDFNSDNDNLKKDIEELLPSVKELEEKRKMILAEIEELERLGRENRSRSEGARLEADARGGASKDEQPRPEGGKVKLKRSPPLVTVKPLIARNNADLRVNQVLPMKNGEVVRPALAPAGEGAADDEDVPLKGIKPKYVPREEEMVEKTVIQEEEEQLQKTSKGTKGKVTSIDDLLAAPAAPVAAPTKVTNIDSILAAGADTADVEKAREGDSPPPAIETPPPSSVAPSDARLSADSEPEQQEASPAGGCEAKEQKEPLEAPPASAPRTSLAKQLSPEVAPLAAAESRKAPEASPRASPRQAPPEKPKSPARPSPPEARPPAARKSSSDALRTAEVSRTSPDASHKLSAGTRRPETQLKEAVNSKVQTPRLEAPLAEVEAAPGAEDGPTASEALRRPSVAKTPSPVLEKAPASRQSSTSSLMTTFGTPIMIASSPQNSSFLHAASTRSIYEAPYAPPSPAYTPATPDFLRDIKAPQEAAAPTAGIQKSALYASTSCLKGLPGAKPVITPKPPILKDKPKVSYRSSGSGSPRVYATPAPIAPRLSGGSISGAVSTPNLASLAAEDRSDAASTSSGASEASSAGPRPDAAAPKRPPPTTQAPAVPAQQGRPQRVAEAVYDVPVAVHAGARDSRDDETIYHEIDDSLQASGAARDAPPGPPAASSASSSPSGSSVDRHESTRCQSRSTFEANRSLLSAALDFGTKATSDNRDGESYSSFTDDFDDDDDDEEPPPLRKAERSSSAVPFYRNSIGPVGTSGVEGAEGAAWAGAAVATAPNPEAAACGATSRPAASRSHSVPRASAHVVSLDASVAAATTAVLVPQSSASTTSSSSRFSFGRSASYNPPSSLHTPPAKQHHLTTPPSTPAAPFPILLSPTVPAPILQYPPAPNRLSAPPSPSSPPCKVIARPEKTAPIYDYTGIYGYVPPAQGLQARGAAPAAAKGSPLEEATPPRRAHCSPVTPPLAKTRPSPYDPSSPSDPALCPQDPALERRESFASESGHAGAPTGHLGYNSEGQDETLAVVPAQATPSPRKVSLESSQGADTPLAESPPDGPPRPRPPPPQRPPPPTRTPSTAGDVRAPITPRKPGRTSSIRGEEDREKRRAPQPPAGAQEDYVTNEYRRFMSLMNADFMSLVNTRNLSHWQMQEISCHWTVSSKYYLHLDPNLLRDRRHLLHNLCKVHMNDLFQKILGARCICKNTVTSLLSN